MNTRDASRIREQEQKDYDTTKEILIDLFPKWNTTFTQMPEFSTSDMRFKAVKDDSENKYNIEIKTNNSDLSIWGTFPLKVKKYIDLLNDTQDDERLLYFVLVNNHKEYYVFDLQHLDLNQCEFKNWRIKKQEYNTNGSEYEEVPVMFIPIKLKRYHGFHKQTKEKNTVVQTK